MTAPFSEPKQLSQTGQTTSVSQELVSSKLLCSGSALDINTQADTQECLELLGQLLWLLEAWGSVCGDEVEGLQWLFVEVWWLGLDHLDGHDTQGPDIDLGTVFLLLDDFWSHPVRSTYHGGTLVAGVGQLGTETKIGNLDIATGREKNVVGLDVTVNNLLRVEVDETLADLE